MTWGLIGALLAAVAYGAATVLQAIGVKRFAGLPAGSSLGHRIRVGLPYVAGLGLDALGFVASAAALRTLPLFLVESAIASSVGVTALLAVRFLGAHLLPREWAALGGVAVGLSLLAISALEGPARHVGRHGGSRLLLMALLVAAALAAGFLIRHPSTSSIVLACTAGLGFGFVGIAARVLDVRDPWWHTVASPVLWALVVHGGLALVAFGYALERGRTTTVAALCFAVETIGPALVGLLFLGDRVRHGFGPLALAGFVVTLAGCVLLARHAEA